MNTSPFVRTFAIVLLLASTSAFGGTKVWTGATSEWWSDPTNWQGGVVPVSGDHVVIPAGSASPSTNDNAVGTLDSLEVDGNVVVDGGSLAFSNPAAITGSGSPKFYPTLYFISPGSTFAMTTTGAVWIESELDVQGGTFTIDMPNADVTFPFHQSAIVEHSSSTAVVVNAHTFEAFFAQVSASGGFTFNGRGSAAVFRTSPEVLGWGPPGACSLPSNCPLPVVVTGDTLADFQSVVDFPIPQPLDLRMSGPNARFRLSSQVASNVAYAAAIKITGPQRFMMSMNPIFKGPISGNGRLILETSSTPTTLSSATNSFSGGIEIQSSATLRAGASGAFPAASELVIDPGGTADLGAYAQTVNRFSCAGTFAIALPASISATHGGSIMGCTLQLTTAPGYVLPVSTEIPLVTNPSGTPFSGTFNGLPEGTSITVNGTPLYISYHGGSSRNDVVLRTTPPTAPGTGDYQDMWWAGPHENGTGLAIVQHDDRIFGALYIYDATGNPTWLALPGGTWSPDRTKFSGSLYRPSGAPFFAYDSSRWSAGNAVGTLTLTIQDNDHAILDYTINGVTGQKLLQREIFAVGPAAAPDRSDLWWGGVSQNGWGITILQQATTLFPIWYTFDATGHPTWYAMPGGTWTATDTYEGEVYRTTSSPWLGTSYDASQLQVFDVGTYRIQFAGDSATFTYAVDGHTGVLQLVREPF